MSNRPEIGSTKWDPYLMLDIGLPLFFNLETQGFFQGFSEVFKDIYQQEIAEYIIFCYVVHALFPKIIHYCILLCLVLSKNFLQCKMYCSTNKIIAGNIVAYPQMFPCNTLNSWFVVIQWPNYCFVTVYSPTPVVNVHCILSQSISISTNAFQKTIASNITKTLMTKITSSQNSRQKMFIKYSIIVIRG